MHWKVRSFQYSVRFATRVDRDSAFTAHRQAWEKAGILHRDISDGNIIIFILPDGSVKGLLIDWDMSKTAQELNKGATNPGRSVRTTSILVADWIHN